MNKMLQQLSKLRLFVMPVTVLLLCSRESQGMNNYTNKMVLVNVNQTDTVPKEKQDDVDKAMKETNEKMSDVNRQMEDVKVNVNKQIEEAVSSVNFEAIQKQIEAGLKQINLNKIQQDVNLSVKEAQDEIAKVDFTNLQNELKTVQDKLNSEEFKSQFNSDKLHKQIDEAMSHAKESIEKANQQLQQMKTFTDALEADGLIDKKKGYKIEWKEGKLYINDQKQPKDISDKYRKYESTGKIKILPEGAEQF